jgi:hypothetical protein
VLKLSSQICHHYLIIIRFISCPTRSRTLELTNLPTTSSPSHTIPQHPQKVSNALSTTCESNTSILNTCLTNSLSCSLEDAPSSYPDTKEGEALRLLEAVKAVKPTAIIGVRYEHYLPLSLQSDFYLEPTIQRQYSWTVLATIFAVTFLAVFADFSPVTTTSTSIPQCSRGIVLQGCLRGNGQTELQAPHLCPQ